MVLLREEKAEKGTNNSRRSNEDTISIGSSEGATSTSSTEQRKQKTLVSTEEEDRKVHHQQQQILIQSLSIYLARIKELIYDEVVVRNNGSSPTTGTIEVVLASSSGSNKSQDDDGNDDSTSNKSTSVPFLLQICRLITEETPQLLPKLLRLLPTGFVPFEGRKNIAAIFNFLLTTGPTVSEIFSSYTLRNYHDVMTPLFVGLDSPDVSPDTSLLCGTMFRSTLKHNALYRKLLDSSSDYPEEKEQQQQQQHVILQQVEDTTPSQPTTRQQQQQANYFQNTTTPSTTTTQQLEVSCRERYLYPIMDRQVFVSNFDSASDALTTLREIFTSNTTIASEYLERDYDTVFSKFNSILQSESYVTKRMSLKLLGELLLNRKYVY